jgi:hypothetical protein
MESLLVDGEDRHLRTAEEAWVVKRADLKNDRRQTWPPSDQMPTAPAAKLPRHRAFKVAALAEPRRRHQQKHVWRAAADLLAFAAMTLRFEHRLRLQPT